MKEKEAHFGEIKEKAMTAIQQRDEEHESAINDEREKAKEEIERLRIELECRS